MVGYTYLKVLVVSLYRIPFTYQLYDFAAPVGPPVRLPTSEMVSPLHIAVSAIDIPACGNDMVMALIVESEQPDVLLCVVSTTLFKYVYPTIGQKPVLLSIHDYRGGC